MLIKSSELTRGEKLALDRRRRKQTMGEAAKRLKVSVATYREWENDEEDVEKKPPNVKLGKIQDYEQCWLLRRREGTLLIELADELGVCRWWLTQMESGRAPIDRLMDYWTEAA